MTLILAATTNHHVFHASDRLITVPSRQKALSKQWDLTSNKTVIAIGSDCWLVLGYTGLAYLDGRPTDQLVAESISGRPDLAGGGVSGWGLPPQQMHYRAITGRISAAIQNAYKRLSAAERAVPTTVLGVGLQQAAPRIRHVIFESVHSSSGTQHRELGRRDQTSASFRFAAVGSPNEQIIAACRAQLMDRGRHSPDTFSSIMADAVRETGARSDVVGEDVMSVTLRPIAREVKVRFSQATTLGAATMPVDKDGGTWAKHPVVYTPFALLPGFIYHPAVASPGEWVVGGGSGSTIQYEIAGDGLEPETGRYYYGSYPRRSSP